MLKMQHPPFKIHHPELHPNSILPRFPLGLVRRATLVYCYFSITTQHLLQEYILMSLPQAYLTPHFSCNISPSSSVSFLQNFFVPVIPRVTTLLFHSLCTAAAWLHQFNSASSLKHGNLAGNVRDRTFYQEPFMECCQRLLMTFLCMSPIVGMKCW
jgi:hypothetical protein